MKVSNKSVLNKIILAAVVIPMTLGSISAFAAGGPGSKDGRFNGRECQISREHKMLRALDLSSEQRDKIRALRQGEQEKMRAQRASRIKVMQQLHEEQNKIVLAKDFNPKAAQLLAKKMVNEQAEVRAKRQIERRVETMHMHHDMMQILTPAQQAKWGELMKQKPIDGCSLHHGKGQQRGSGFHDGRKAPRL